jgi:ATP-dependent Clp protease ATP-binding subunit ClpB
MDLATASHLLYPALKGAAKAARAAQARQDRQQETRRMQTQVVLDPRQTGREARALEETLDRMIVGQDEAIRQIVDIYQMNLTGMCPLGRPVGNFLFLGPTGSGKTRIVEAAAEGLVGNAHAVIKVDCAEFQHSHEIAKLIGSPPGYLGHRETHPLLSQEVLNQHHTETVKLSFVLFDEIEKASDSLWNLLLGILDKATLTLGDNRKVDFSRAMIFLTSNLGANEMTSLLAPRLGFLAGPGDGSRTGREDDRLAAKITKSGIEAARKKFTPEFMNRLDKVVVFKPLGEADLRRILDIELGYVQQRIFQAGGGERAFVLQIGQPAKEFLLRQGIDPKYGARHLKRAIERILVQPLSNLIATAQVRTGDLVSVALSDDGGGLTFVRESEGLPAQAMQEIAGTNSLLALGQMTRGAGAEAARVGVGRARRG